MHIAELWHDHYALKNAIIACLAYIHLVKGGRMRDAIHPFRLKGGGAGHLGGQRQFSFKIGWTLLEEFSLHIPIFRNFALCNCQFEVLIPWCACGVTLHCSWQGWPKISAKSYALNTKQIIIQINNNVTFVAQVILVFMMKTKKNYIEKQLDSFWWFLFLYLGYCVIFSKLVTFLTSIYEMNFKNELGVSLRLTFNVFLACAHESHQNLQR